MFCHWIKKWKNKNKLKIYKWLIPALMGASALFLSLFFQKIESSRFTQCWLIHHGVDKINNGWPTTWIFYDCSDMRKIILGNCST